jgi:hypothetical protein
MKFNGLLKHPPAQQSLGLQKGVSGLFRMPPSPSSEVCIVHGGV